MTNAILASQQTLPDHTQLPESDGTFVKNFQEHLGLELGIWQGTYQNVELPWLRWWTMEGELLLTGEEKAEQEKQRAERERKRAELAELEVIKLRELLQKAGREVPEINLSNPDL